MRMLIQFCIVIFFVAILVTTRETYPRVEVPTAISSLIPREKITEHISGPSPMLLLPINCRYWELLYHNHSRSLPFDRLEKQNVSKNKLKVQFEKESNYVDNFLKIKYFKDVVNEKRLSENHFTFYKNKVKINDFEFSKKSKVVSSFIKCLKVLLLNSEKHPRMSKCPSLLAKYIKSYHQRNGTELQKHPEANVGINFRKNKNFYLKGEFRDSLALLKDGHSLRNGSSNHLRFARRVFNGPTELMKQGDLVLGSETTPRTDIELQDLNSGNESLFPNSSISGYDMEYSGDILTSNGTNSSRPYWMDLPIGKLHLEKASSDIHPTSSPIEILHRFFKTKTFQKDQFQKQLQQLFRDEKSYDKIERSNISSIVKLFFANESRDKKYENIWNILELLSIYNNISNLSDIFRNDSSIKVAMVILDTEGIVRIPCYAIIFLLGIVGNSLVILTLLQNRKMRTVTNVFLLNLAISDLLLGVFCMPFTLIGSLLRDFVFGAVMCRMIPYFQATSISVSVWTLVAISMERHYAICHPLQSRGWQTLSHSYKVITLVWISSFIIMTPIATLSELVPIGNTGRHKCREVWPFLNLERSFSIFLAVALLLVPLVIMVAAYSSISISLWHGMKLERRTGQGSLHLISMTDLNSLAVVQQSLRSHSSTPKKQSAKISIRFRKYPSPVTNCQSCCREEATLVTPNHSTIACVSKNISIDAAQINSPATAYAEANKDLQCCSLSQRDKEESDCENGNDLVTLSPCLQHHHFSCSSNGGANKLRSTHLEKSIAAKRHVIKMLFVVVLEFFICWTPIFVVNILYLYIPEQVYAALGPVGISFLHLLSYASSCCNPITYCFMNRKFLQGFKQDLKCCRSREEKNINLDICNLRSLNNKTIDKSNHFKFDREETNM